MSIKSDKWIRRMAEQHGMIEPFEPGQVRERDGQRIISYGTSSYGYDHPLRPRGSRCSPTSTARWWTRRTSTRRASSISTATAASSRPTASRWRAPWSTSASPRNVLTICLGKSTYARCGIIVNVTPFEPEWEGYVTLEFSNTTPLPAKIYAGEGCAQVLFFESDEVCEVSYKDRGGKYPGPARR